MLWRGTINNSFTLLHVCVVRANAGFVNPGHRFVVLMVFRLVYDDARPLPRAGASTIQWKPIICA